MLEIHLEYCPIQGMKYYFIEEVIFEEKGSKKRKRKNHG